MTGRSRGGPTTKIHALAYGDGRLYAVMLMAGSVHDVQGGRAQLASAPQMRQQIWRAIATRYDKTARNFLAGVCFAIAVRQWIR